jgi:hypothetical protein
MFNLQFPSDPSSSGFKASPPSPPAGSVDPSFPYLNTTEAYEDAEGNRAQGPQAGDHDFHSRHMADRIVDENMAGVSNFDPGNTPDDAIFAIATGPNTGPQLNPAPDAMHSSSPGLANETMPGSGTQFPIPTPAEDVSVNPGVQKSFDVTM